MPISPRGAHARARSGEASRSDAARRASSRNEPVRSGSGKTLYRSLSGDAHVRDDLSWELSLPQASALAFSWSNSGWVMVPESSNDFAEAIWSAAPAPLAAGWLLATDRM
jgi:hypothetical protein